MWLNRSTPACLASTFGARRNTDLDPLCRMAQQLANSGREVTLAEAVGSLACSAASPLCLKAPPQSPQTLGCHPPRYPPPRQWVAGSAHSNLPRQAPRAQTAALRPAPTPGQSTGAHGRRRNSRASHGGSAPGVRRDGGVAAAGRHAALTAVDKGPIVACFFLCSARQRLRSFECSFCSSVRSV